MEKVNCIICNSTESSHFLSCKDVQVSQETFTLVKCNSCGFCYTNPRPEEINIGKYYKAESYISHTDSSKGFINKIYKMVRTRTIKSKVNLVSKYVSRGTILDIGCGTGVFANGLLSAGFSVKGLEVDPDARKIAKDVNGIVAASTLSELENDKFDAITMWHVLEHVHDIIALTNFFKNNINGKGVVIIAVPNLESYDANHYKEHWAAYDVPKHLYHFREKDVIALMENAGYKHQESLPMNFDSVYVSMLSEKHMGAGFMGLIKACIVGAISNLKGWLNNNNTSSKIYVFKKK